MADSEQDKSEQPTSYKLQQARRKGTVARGMDLGFLSALCVLLAYSWWAGSDLIVALHNQLRIALVSSSTLGDGPAPLLELFRMMAWPIARLLAMLLLAVVIVVGVLEIVQTGVVFSSQPLKPDFSRLNPAQGLKRLFSARLLIETVKNVLKFSIYGGISYAVIRDAVNERAGSIVDGATLGSSMGSLGLRLLAVFAGIALFFAIADQLISRREFSKKMRMSRREVRREHRDREGEPRLKQKRKQLHGEFVKTSQSLRGLKGADVVVANPEHIAVALRFDAARMVAPTVVSSGTDALAQRIKRLALSYGIVVIEDRPLAQKLHREAKLGQAIPEGCYAPVADVYNSLRRKRRQAEAATHHAE